MSEQVVLITGALTGIGRATAIVFAREGAKIVVSGRHDKEGQKLVMELRNLGAEAEFVRADVRQKEISRNSPAPHSPPMVESSRAEKSGLPYISSTEVS